MSKVPSFPRRRKGPGPRRGHWVERFLLELAEGHTITRSAEAAGKDRADVYKLRQQDPEFMRAWDDAYEQGTDKLEEEALRRALEGWTEPVYYQGKVRGHVRKFDTTLALELLRARRPEKYRQRIETRNAGEGRPLTAKDLETIRALGARPDLETAWEQLAGALADAAPQEQPEPVKA